MLHEVHSDFVRKTHFCKRSLREKERKQEREVGAMAQYLMQEQGMGSSAFLLQGSRSQLWHLLSVCKAKTVGSPLCLNSPAVHGKSWDLLCSELYQELKEAEMLFLFYPVTVR